MTQKEIKEKIDDLETRKFYLAMKDRWNSKDYDYNRELAKQIKELKELLDN